MCYIEPLSVLSVCLSVYDVNVAYCHNRGQSVGWINVPLDMKVDLGPGNIVLDGDPAPHQKGGTAAPHTFRPMFIVAKRLDGSRCYLVWRYALAQAILC